MDRCKELVDIYAQSSLPEVLSKKSVNFHEKDNFTKLIFGKNDWNIRAIEIYEHKKGPYFRIHHNERIVHWLKIRINTIPGTVLRATNTSGSSLDGDFLHIARQLLEILRPTRIAQGNRTTNA